MFLVSVFHAAVLFCRPRASPLSRSLKAVAAVHLCCGGWIFILFFVLAIFLEMLMVIMGDLAAARQLVSASQKTSHTEETFAQEAFHYYCYFFSSCISCVCVRWRLCTHRLHPCCSYFDSVAHDRVHIYVVLLYPFFLSFCLLCFSFCCLVIRYHAVYIYIYMVYLCFPFCRLWTHGCLLRFSFSVVCWWKGANLVCDTTIYLVHLLCCRHPLSRQESAPIGACRPPALLPLPPSLPTMREI